MYFFLGSRLQNRISYVPITRDGEIVDHGPENDRLERGNFESWEARLRAEETTHLMCFRPAAIELSWAETHPGMFERLDGDGESWGLYGVR